MMIPVNTCKYIMICDWGNCTRKFGGICGNPIVLQIQFLTNCVWEQN